MWIVLRNARQRHAQVSSYLITWKRHSVATSYHPGELYDTIQRCCLVLTNTCLWWVNIATPWGKKFEEAFSLSTFVCFKDQWSFHVPLNDQPSQTALQPVIDASVVITALLWGRTPSGTPLRRNSLFLQGSRVGSILWTLLWKVSVLVLLNFN